MKPLECPLRASGSWEPIGKKVGKDFIGEVKIE